MAVKINKDDYIGKTFHLLTIIELCPIIKYKPRLAKTICKCGTIKNIVYSLLSNRINALQWTPQRAFTT